MFKTLLLLGFLAVLLSTQGPAAPVAISQATAQQATGQVTGLPLPRFVSLGAEYVIPVGRHVGVALRLGGYNNGPWFFEGAVSYSDLDYDQLKRKFSLGPVLQRTETADTTGTTLGVKFNAGLNLVDSGSNYRFGPIWGLEYIDADVDGYSEKGSTATALRVKDMSTTAGIISAGLFADRKLGFCVILDPVFAGDDEEPVAGAHRHAVDERHRPAHWPRIATRQFRQTARLRPG